MNIRSTIIGTTVLVVLLTAGTAQSLSGTNTVTSDDIVDFTIVANDIKTAAIGGRPIVDNSMTGADVNERTLNMAGNCGPGLTGGHAIILMKSADLEFVPSTNGVAYPYNCAGGEVQTYRGLDSGYAFVKFVGNEKRVAVATIDNHNPTIAVTATVDDVGPGEFLVRTLAANGAPVDADFEIVIY